MFNFFILLILSSFLFCKVNLSLASNLKTVKEIKNGIIHINFDKIIWNELKLKNNNSFVLFSSSTLIISTKICNQDNIPIKIIYDSESRRNSLNSYYVIKPNKKIYLKVFKFTLSSNNEKHKFKRIEIDESFANCFKEFTFSPESKNIFLLKSGIDLLINSSKSNYSKSLRNEVPIIFDIIYSKNLVFDIKDSSYSFKSLIKPNELGLSTNELVNICNPVNLISKFEIEVLGRPIVCGVTSELATIQFYKLRKNEGIHFRGNVVAGSFSLFVKRKNGGLVKVININNGNFDDKFVASENGEYSLYLSINHIIYNYPFLYFKLFLSQSKF